MNNLDDQAAEWSQLHHPLVRDLAWCLLSPPLAGLDNAAAADFDKSAKAELWPFFLRLDANPDPLQRWMAECPSPRLGFVFERYWQFWWLYGPDSDNRREYRFNLQIHHDGRTRGELDCLMHQPVSGNLVHTELAVKFYLGIDGQQLPKNIRADGPGSWVGPNIRDRLDLKLEQMREHQLKLLHRDEHHKVIPAQWQWRQLHTRLLVRGRLFYPCHGNPCRSELPSPADAALDHLRGYWIHLRDCDRLPPLAWLPLQRHQWFAPIQLEISQSVRCRHICHSSSALHLALHQHFQHFDQPLQLAGLTLQGQNWQESKRLFVVPDHWPGTT